MTFNDLRRSLLLRPEYGTIKAREEMEKEIWNAALDAAIDAYSKWEYARNFPGPVEELIEKLKV